MKPLAKTDAQSKKNTSIPDFVIEAFNNQIVANLSASMRAKVMQNSVINDILRLAPEGTTRHTIFDNKWLDVEDLFRSVGWKVDYDKPAYCESYEAYFIFS